MSQSPTTENDALPEDVRKVLEGFTIGLTFGLAAIVYALRDKRAARPIPPAEVSS
jgi:hypothetical protein